MRGGDPHDDFLLGRLLLGHPRQVLRHLPVPRRVAALKPRLGHRLHVLEHPRPEGVGLRVGFRTALQLRGEAVAPAHDLPVALVSCANAIGVVSCRRSVASPAPRQL